MRHGWSLLVCCAGALLVAGCGKHEGASAAKPSAAASAPAPAKPASIAHTASTHAIAPTVVASTRAPATANTAFHVASLTLGTLIDANYAVTTPTTQFTPDTPTIYASVATEGKTAGATLQARWRYLEGKGVLVNELQQTVTADGAAITTFKVQNPNRWPAGKYRVEISLDGKVVAQQGFEITDGKAAK